MDGQAIVTVSAAVVALVQLAKWAGLDDSKGPLGVLVLSLLGVAFWGWSQNDFTRETGFTYFAGWIAVMTSAAGVYGFTRATGDGLTKMKGTGNGLALLVLLVGSVTLAGCASLPRIQPLPAEVEHADRDIKAVTGNLLQLLTMSAAVMNTVSKLEDEAARSGLVPTAADAKFDAAMVAYADASDAAVKGLTSGALKTWPQLRSAVEPILARGQTLIDTAAQIGAIKTKATSFLAQLRDLLSAAVGEFMFGGAR